MTADGNCCSALNDYYRAFSAYDTHRALSYYNVPVVFTTAEGVTVAATTSESATRLAKLYETLKPTGFARSELTNLQIKQMSAGLVTAPVAAPQTVVIGYSIASRSEGARL